MVESSAATPLPDPSGAGATNPNLSVVPPEKKRRSPSQLNQAQALAVGRFTLILLAALKPAHYSVLVGYGIEEQFLFTLRTDIEALLGKANSAASFTSQKEGDTITGHDAVKTLMKGLRKVQALARRKYQHSDPAKLPEFGIGTRMDESRGVLDQCAEGVIAKADAERFPGIDTTFIDKLKADRLACTTSNSDQSSDQGSAKTERELRDAQFKSVKDRAEQIQFAADAAWPPKTPGSGGFRRKFLLPLNRPYVP